jgi:hypothetical protein
MLVFHIEGRAARAVIGGMSGSPRMVLEAQLPPK